VIPIENVHTRNTMRKLVLIAIAACGGAPPSPEPVANHVAHPGPEVHVAFATTQQAADSSHELVFASPHRLAAKQVTLVQLDDSLRISRVDIHEVTTLPFLSREGTLSELADRPPPLLYAGPIPAGDVMVMPGSTAIIYDPATPAALVALTAGDRAALLHLKSPWFYDVENLMEPGIDVDGDGHADLAFLPVCIDGPPPEEPEAEVCEHGVFVARRDTGGWLVTDSCAEENRTRCHHQFEAP
jgi:hypothetical protein